MACTPIPTQTLFEVVTTSTVSTSTSESVTTIPPELSTIFTTFCGTETVDTNGTTTCASTETSSIITTISSEQVKTVESQVILQIPVTTSFPTSTLFSTCPTSDPPTSPPTSPPTTTHIQTDASIIVSSATSTFPNGSVIVTVITSTATIVPTWALIPTDAAGDHNGRDVQTNLATIIGSTLGGFLGLLIIVLIGWSIWRKRKSIHALHLTDQMWSNDRSALYGRRKDIDSSIIDGEEPKPYQYGIVGRREHETTPSPRSSPNPSPAPTRPQSLAHTGPYAPGSPPHSARLSPTPYIPDHTLAFASQPPTPNAQRAASPYLAVPPASPSLDPPAGTGSAPASAPARTHRASDSVASIGTAVSYPYQVPVPVVDREPHDAQDREDEGAGPAAEARRPTRMSLKLANWNPETDGEL